MKESTILPNGEKNLFESFKGTLWGDVSNCDDIYYHTFQTCTVDECRKWFSELSEQRKLEVFLEVCNKQWTFSHMLETMNLSCLEENFLESAFFKTFVEIINAVRLDSFRAMREKFERLLATNRKD